MNPCPKVPQYQCHSQKRQPQPGVPRAGADSRLSHLPETSLDAESQTVHLGDFGWRTMHTPRREQQLLMSLLAVLAVAMSAIADTYRNLQRLLFMFMACGYQPAGRRLIQRRPVGFVPFSAHARESRRASRTEVVLPADCHNRSVEECEVQQQTPDSQADSRILATMRRNTHETSHNARSLAAAPWPQPRAVSIDDGLGTADLAMRRKCGARCEAE